MSLGRVQEDTEYVGGERGRRIDFVKCNAHLEFLKINFNLETALNRVDHIFFTENFTEFWANFRSCQQLF